MEYIQADKGFYFGIGAFETMSLYQGKIHNLGLHLTRLHNTLKFLGIERIVTEKMIYDYVKACKRTDGVIKLAVTEKNLDFSYRDNSYTKELYNKGFDVCFAPWKRNETSPFTYHKTLNHAENIYAHDFALNQECNEALFCNTKGEVCEGSCTNLFLVKCGKIYTPSSDCGLLNGTMRTCLMQNEEITECHIKAEELAEFDEAFLTNSLMGIMRVNRIGKAVYTQNSVIRKLQKCKRYKTNNAF